MIATIIVFAICLPLLWLILRNPTLYSADKQTVSEEVSSSLDAVRLKQSPKYHDVIDGGCDDRNSVGLATVATCSIIGYQYYESSGDISSDMQTLQALISKEGWSTPSNIIGSKTVDYTKKTSKNQPPSPYAPPQLHLTTYRQQQDDTIVDELIKQGRIKPLTVGTSLYGVRITETYWSCRSDSILTSCSPPSTSHL